ncbi:MAG: hypothetical protein LBE20_01335 [Deltaproteobacteria bacterium]|jgi:hypothetical protein|nr:hypothetical protein [Deltaproteobacteria bacterium]
MFLFFEKILNLQNSKCPKFLALAVIQITWGVILTAKRLQNSWAAKKLQPPFHNSEIATLCQAITSNYPFVKVLELGVNLYPTFDTLSSLLPQVKFVAVTNQLEKLVIFQSLYQTRTNVTVLSLELNQLTECQDLDFDIVYTSNVLSYCNKQLTVEIIRELLRVSRRKIFLLELQTPNQYNAETNFYDVEGSAALFVRDYVQLTKNVATLMNIQIDVTYSKIKHPLWTNKYWKNYGSLIEIEKK